VIFKVLLPQSNIMAAFVHCQKSIFSDLSSDLPTYKNHVAHFTSMVVVVLLLLLLFLQSTNCNLVLKKQVKYEVLIELTSSLQCKTEDV